MVSPTATVEKLAGGYQFLEGPLWRPDGTLWFSDLVGNVTFQWSPDGKVKEVLNPGGNDAKDSPAGAYLGSNGMTAGPDNSVILCQHGNRRIVRVSADRTVTVLLDRYDGKRLNSPNDVVYARDGSLYFTDPPYGLINQDEDPAKELTFNGVYRFSGGRLQLIISDMARPNGLAFSPDYKTLYVANTEPERLWMRYDIAEDGTAANGRVFVDASAWPDPGVPDGLKVDSAGNIYATGPGGVCVFSPDGKHLGTIKVPENPANCAWGGDGKTLYITAVTSLYRIRLNTTGQKTVYS